MVDDEMHMSMIRPKLVELQVKYMLNTAIVGKKKEKNIHMERRLFSLSLLI